MENAINEGAKLNHVETEVKNILPTEADIRAEKYAADFTTLPLKFDYNPVFFDLLK